MSDDVGSFYYSMPLDHPAREHGYTGPGWYFWNEDRSKCYGPYPSCGYCDFERARFRQAVDNGPKAPRTASALLHKSAIPFDAACSMVKEYEALLKIARDIILEQGESAMVQLQFKQHNWLNRLNKILPPSA